MNPLDRPIVVVADRDAAFAEEAKRELVAGGFGVQTVADIGELLSLRATRAVDVVLLDQHLPAAWQFLREANGRGRPSPPIVMLSGDPSIEDAVAAVKQGAADYRAKSLSWQALRDVCGVAIEEARAAAYLEWTDAGDRPAEAGDVSDNAKFHLQRMRLSIRGLIGAASGDRQRSRIDGRAASAGELRLRAGLCLIELIEKQAMIEAIAQARGNVVAAAKLLGVGQATVYRKIKRYDIPLRERRPRRSPEVVPTE